MKTKIKTNTAHINNNTKKIKNWPEYNKSLKNRGNLSIFISESLIKDRRLVMPSRTGKPGRPMEYPDELIEFVLTIRELYRLPLRQATGFLEFLFRLMGITSVSPDYTTVSKRMPGIRVRYQRKLNKYKNNDGILMLIDSSGFKVFGEGEWKNSVDYHRRSLVENAFYRWKTIFGDRLKSRKNESQYTEQCLKAKIINKFNELGLPKYDITN